MILNQVARELGVHPQIILKVIKEKSLPYSKAGHFYLIPPETVNTLRKLFSSGYPRKKTSPLYIFNPEGKDFELPAKLRGKKIVVKGEVEEKVKRAILVLPDDPFQAIMAFFKIREKYGVWPMILHNSQIIKMRFRK